MIEVTYTSHWEQSTRKCVVTKYHEGTSSLWSDYFVGPICLRILMLYFTKSHEMQGSVEKKRCHTNDEEDNKI